MDNGSIGSNNRSASVPPKLKAFNTTLTNKDSINAKTFFNFLDSYAKPHKTSSFFRSNRDPQDLITMANKFTLPDPNPRAAKEPGTMPDAQQLRIATAITTGKFGDPIPEDVAMKLKGILTFFTVPSAKTIIDTAIAAGKFGAPISGVVATKQGGTSASTEGSALPGASAGEGGGNPLYIDSSLPTEAPRGAEETSVSGGGGGENDSFKEEQLITINGLPQLFTDINLDSSLNDYEKYKKIFDATVPNLEGPLENKIRLVVVIKDFPEINQQYKDWVSRVKEDLVSELTSDLSKIYRSDMDSEDKTVAKDTHVATLRSKGYDTGVLVECLKQLPDELKKHLDETIQGLSTPDKPQGGASVSGGGGRGSSLSAEAPRGAEETASAPSDALDKEKIIMFLFDSKNSGRGIKNIELALHLMETYDQAFLSSLADKIESNLSKKSISFGWTMVNLLKGYKPGDNVSPTSAGPFTAIGNTFVITNTEANALYKRSQLGTRTRTPLDKANTDLLLSAKAPQPKRASVSGGGGGGGGGGGNPLDSKTDSARGGSSSPEAVRVRDSLRTEFDKINRSDKTGYEKSEAKNIYIAILESEGLDPPVLFNLLTNLGLEYTKGLEDKIEALSHDHKPQGGASVSGGGGGGNPLHFQSAGGAEETSSVKTAATGSVTTVTKSDVKIGNTVLKMVSKDIVRSDSQVKVNGTNPKQEGGGGLEKAFREAPVFGPLYVSSAKSANAAGLVLQPGKIYRHDVSNAGTPTKCILNALAPRATEYGPTGIRSGTWQDKLAETYENIMDSAKTTGFSTLEIPQIGTGIYGCDPKESAKIAVKTVTEWLRQNRDTKITEVRFNFYIPGNSNPDNHYVAAFNEVLFTI